MEKIFFGIMKIYEISLFILHLSSSDLKKKKKKIYKYDILFDKNICTMHHGLINLQIFL